MTKGLSLIEIYKAEGNIKELSAEEHPKVQQTEIKPLQMTNLCLGHLNYRVVVKIKATEKWL